MIGRGESIRSEKGDVIWVMGRGKTRGGGRSQKDMRWEEKWDGIRVMGRGKYWRLKWKINKRGWVLNNEKKTRRREVRSRKEMREEEKGYK